MPFVTSTDAWKIPGENSSPPVRLLANHLSFDARTLVLRADLMTNSDDSYIGICTKEEKRTDDAVMPVNGGSGQDEHR